MGGDGLAAARALLPGVRLDHVEHLGGNDRSIVDRVRGHWPDGAEQSLIVKRYQSAGEGWVREAAALSVLRGTAEAPRVVAIGREPPVLVLTDLGAGPSVADALLGDDPEAAQAALDAWARALAELHAATGASQEALRAALDGLQGDLPVSASRMPVDIEDAVRALDRTCTGLDLRVPDGAFEQLRGLARRLGGGGPAAVSPADACPDNNVFTARGLVLVDFEGAQWRHVAWDLAYLKVPWPTCWCSWRLPDAAAEHAVATYVRAAARAVPEVESAEFGGDLEAAVVGWALMSTTWFVDNALADDPPLNPDRPTPSRRAMITHRLRCAAASTELPAAAELAGRLLAVLTDRWGDVPLAFAPAFRGDQ